MKRLRKKVKYLTKKLREAKARELRLRGMLETLLADTPEPEE